MERSILPGTWQVPAEFRRRLGKKPGRQRAMQAEDHLLLVLHRPPGPDEIERQGRYFWRQPDGSWSSSDHGAGSQSLQRHLDEYAEQLQQLDQREEQATSAPDYFDVLNRVGPLLRAARNMHHVLQEARKLCPQDRELIHLRDHAYEIERTAELLHQDTKHSLDYLVAKRAEEYAATSQRMETAAHRLNVLAAFFLPIATLSAVLEVTPDQIQQHLETPLILAVLVAAGLVCGWLLTLAIRR